MPSQPAVYQVGKVHPEEFAGVLSSSIPPTEAIEQMGGIDALRSAVNVWLHGYAFPETDIIRQTMIDSGVETPESWANASTASDLFEFSTLGLRQIEFDPALSRVIVIHNNSVHPFQGRPKRSGTRDSARGTLLENDARSRLARREVLFGGTVTDPQGVTTSVTFGMEFAWDGVNSRWVLIRTSLYEFPNEIEGSAPLL